MSNTNEISALGSVPGSSASAEMRKALLQDVDLNELARIDDEVRFAPNNSASGGSCSGSSCGTGSAADSTSSSACGAAASASGSAGSACAAAGCCSSDATNLGTLAADIVNATSKNIPGSTKVPAAAETDPVLNSFGELMFDFARKQPSASTSARA